MICKYCGSSYEENDKFCPICGRSTTGELESVPEIPVYQPSVDTQANVDAAVKNSKNGIAVASFIFSLISILLPGVGMIFGANMVGFWLGIFGVKSNRKGFAIAGIVISILSTVFILVLYGVVFAIMLDNGSYEELITEFGY